MAAYLHPHPDRPDLPSITAPGVAVVIISYHGDPYLHDAIESVLNQTVRELEVVVVEDGSHDRAAEIVDSFGDPRLRYIWQPNQGPNAARNTGIRATTAPLVAFLDCDDWWSPQKLSAQLAALEAAPEAEAVYSSALVVRQRGGIQGRLSRARVAGDLFPQLLRSNCITASSLMATRSLLERAGNFDERIRYAEDWECWIRLARLAPFAKVEEQHVFVLARENSASRNTEALRLAAHGVLASAYEDLPEKYQHLKAQRRTSLANIEFGAAIDYSERRLPGKAFKPLLRAISYDPFQGRFWRRLILLVLGRV